jgi:hypothetical protein
VSKTIFVAVYTVITGPPREAYGLVALIVAILAFLIYLNKRWAEAQPN